MVGGRDESVNYEIGARRGERGREGVLYCRATQARPRGSFMLDDLSWGLFGCGVRSSPRVEDLMEPPICE